MPMNLGERCFFSMPENYSGLIIVRMTVVFAEMFCGARNLTAATKGEG